jgi:hypothetical protein
MRESYIKPFGAKYPMTWRSYVWRVVIGHALVLIGWPIIAFLTTGNWLNRWQLGIATATVPAVSALVWGYFRKTKPMPLDPEFEAKLELFRELERESKRKLEDLP